MMKATMRNGGIAAPTHRVTGKMRSSRTRWAEPIVEFSPGWRAILSAAFAIEAPPGRCYDTCALACGWAVASRGQPLAPKYHSIIRGAIGGQEIRLNTSDLNSSGDQAVARCIFNNQFWNDALPSTNCAYRALAWSADMVPSS